MYDHTVNIEIIWGMRSRLDNDQFDDVTVLVRNVQKRGIRQEYSVQWLWTRPTGLKVRHHSTLANFDTYMCIARTITRRALDFTYSSPPLVDVIIDTSISTVSVIDFSPFNNKHHICSTLLLELDRIGKIYVCKTASLEKIVMFLYKKVLFILLKKITYDISLKRWLV